MPASRFAGALSGGMFKPPAGSYFEVKTEAWQPSSTPFPRKVYEVQIRTARMTPWLRPPRSNGGNATPTRPPRSQAHQPCTS